jgi:hypothetical protein
VGRAQGIIGAGASDVAKLIRTNKRRFWGDNDPVTYTEMADIFRREAAKQGVTGGDIDLLIVAGMDQIKGSITQSDYASLDGHVPAAMSGANLLLLVLIDGFVLLSALAVAIKIFRGARVSR